MKRPHTESWAGLREAEVLGWSNCGKVVPSWGGGDVGVWVWEITQWEKRKWGQENLRSAPQHPQKVVGHSSYCPGTIEAR